jgi:hypothetical protein
VRQWPHARPRPGAGCPEPAGDGGTGSGHRSRVSLRTPSRRYLAIPAALPSGTVSSAPTGSIGLLVQRLPTPHGTARAAGIPRCRRLALSRLARGAVRTPTRVRPRQWCGGAPALPGGRCPFPRSRSCGSPNPRCPASPPAVVRQVRLTVDPHDPILWGILCLFSWSWGRSGSRLDAVDRMQRTQ